MQKLDMRENSPASPFQAWVYTKSPTCVTLESQPQERPPAPAAHTLQVLEAPSPAGAGASSTCKRSSLQHLQVLEAPQHLLQVLEPPAPAGAGIPSASRCWSLQHLQVLEVLVGPSIQHLQVLQPPAPAGARASSKHENDMEEANTELIHSRTAQKSTRRPWAGNGQPTPQINLGATILAQLFSGWMG